MRVFSNALYVLDDGLDSQAIAEVFALARQHQAQVTVVDVIAEPSMSPGPASRLGGREELLQRVLAAREAKLRQTLATFAEGADVQVQVRTGRRYLEVIKMVLADGYDMVIKVAEEVDWLGRFFTSDDMHLLRKCPCPVWLMHRGAPARHACVLASIDFDPDEEASEGEELNDRILQFAAAVAAFESAELRVVHAWESPVAGFAGLWSDVPEEAERQYRDGEYSIRQDLMRAAQERLKARVGEETFRFLEPRSQLLHGRPEACIPSHAAEVEASVVVMGTVARTGVPGLIIGNTAEDILQQLRCSVLAIKPEGFESPVRLD